MIWYLLDALRSGLAEHFKDTVYEQPPPRRDRQPPAGVPPEHWAESLRQPVIYVGDLPPKRSNPEAPEDYPFILLRVPSGESGEQGGIRTHNPLVHILIGTWTNDGEEPQHIQSAQVLYRVLQWLMSRQFIDRRYERMLPLRWGMGVGGDTYSAGAQLKQYSVGWIAVQFKIRAEIDDIGPEFALAYGTGLT